MDTSRSMFGVAALRSDVTRSPLARIVRLLKAFRYQRAVASAYDAAADYYDNWEWQRLWGKTEWPLLREVLGRPKSVLEIGIGTGAVAERILQETKGSIARYVGVDLSTRMLDRCRARLGSRVDLCQADASRITLGDFGAPFDFVLSCRMLGHISTPRRLFAEVYEVLSPDGRFVVTDLDPRHGYTATRLPTKDGRIEVPTFKHSAASVISAAEKEGLRLVQLYRTYEDTARNLGGNDAPHSLAGRAGPLSNLFVFEKAPAQQS